MELKTICKIETELEEVATQLLTNFKDDRIFLFFGDMGVGKTTFIKQICKNLGVTDLVNSPTFSIVNEYHAKEPIYHLDMYRLKEEQEAYDIGYEEYLYSGYYCFIEWPTRIMNLLPKNAIAVHMENNCGDRLIHIKPV